MHFHQHHRHRRPQAPENPIHFLQSRWEHFCISEKVVRTKANHYLFPCMYLCIKDIQLGLVFEECEVH